MFNGNNPYKGFKVFQNLTSKRAAVYKELLSLPYFTGSFKALFKDRKPRALEEKDIYAPRLGMTILKEGAWVYGHDAPSKPVLDISKNMSRTRRNEVFQKLDPRLVQMFQNLLNKIEKDGNQAVLWLPPLAPSVYNSEYKEKFKLKEVEDFLKDTAKKRRLTLVGSYDPAKCHVSSDDFLDPIHLTNLGITKVFEHVRL